MSLIVIQDHGPVRHVVLNRPEKRNAMNQALLRELSGALQVRLSGLGAARQGSGAVAGAVASRAA